MKHYLYVVHADDPAPASGFDAGSWLLYYKWNVEGETFVPIDEPARTKMLTDDPHPGDMLWFILDAKVLGGVPITRLEDERSQRRIEVWYDADKRRVPASNVDMCLASVCSGPNEQVGQQLWALTENKLA